MSRTKILKLVRMDGEALEFEVDRNDVNAILELSRDYDSRFL